MAYWCFPKCPEFLLEYIVHVEWETHYATLCVSCIHMRITMPAKTPWSHPIIMTFLRDQLFTKNPRVWPTHDGLLRVFTATSCSCGRLVCQSICTGRVLEACPWTLAPLTCLPFSSEHSQDVSHCILSNGTAKESMNSAMRFWDVKWTPAEFQRFSMMFCPRSTHCSLSVTQIVHSKGLHLRNNNVLFQEYANYWLCLSYLFYHRGRASKIFEWSGHAISCGGRGLSKSNEGCIVGSLS